MAHGVGVQSVSAEEFQQPVTGHLQQSGNRERRRLVLSPLSLTQCGTSGHIHSGLPLQLNLSGSALPDTPTGVSPQQFLIQSSSSKLIIAWAFPILASLLGCRVKSAYSK